MKAEVKNAKRVVLFASIAEDQHDILRYIAFKEKRSIADIAREAISTYISNRKDLKAFISRNKTGEGENKWIS